MSAPADALQALRRFARAPGPDAERCEVCAQPLAERHAHLYDPRRRRLCCACEGCAPGAGRASSPWKRVPTRVLALRGLSIPTSLWRALGVHVELAFLRRVGADSAVEVLASYPSAAGPTETRVEFVVWQQVLARHSALPELLPDVEALLANRLNGAESYYLAPIDECYRLVGLLRSQPFGRGAEPMLRPALAGFFRELSARAEVRDA
jgi:hypothetical protein